MQPQSNPIAIQERHQRRKYVTDDMRAIKALRYSFEKFIEVRQSVKTLLPELEAKARQKPPKVVRPKRNYYRRIIKEVRVIRVLRTKSGVSQLQAARMCGYARAVFGHIENGRIEVPEERLKHIVRCLGHEWGAFQKLMKAEVLRDELIEQCTHYLKNLDDTRLESAATVIKALLK
jgi:transcriptional regulator with XRE-family HTH domain